MTQLSRDDTLYYTPSACPKQRAAFHVRSVWRTEINDMTIRFSLTD
jgi:Zn-dependent protease